MAIVNEVFRVIWYFCISYRLLVSKYDPNESQSDKTLMQLFKC